MKNRTLEEFLSAFSKGKRHFVNWDFDEDLSLKGMDLTNVYFEKCFLFFDFTETKLINAKFIGCNLKTADFQNADLTNATIKHCSVESSMFNGAKTDTLIFEENYYFGITINQKDFKGMVKGF